jgi:hypothetical protein
VNGRQRPWWRSTYVVFAASVFLAAGAVAVGSTLASFSAETDNSTGTLASGYVGAASGVAGTASGYDAALTWTAGTHGPVTAQQIYGQDNGTSTSCPSSGYSAGATATAAAASRTQSNTHATTTLSAAITTTTATSLTVASSTGFPSTPFTIVVDSELMTVTNVAGTTWTVTRGVSGSTATLHLSRSGVTFVGKATTTLSAAISSTSATSITVASSSGFPATPFTIGIDTEQMTVTNVSGTTWTVARHANGTTAATHLNGATVTSLTDPYNGRQYCYEIQSQSATNWTAFSSPAAVQLGLLPTGVTITNNGTAGTIDKTDVIVVTFNQQTNYPTTSQTVNVCAFTSGVVLLGDTNNCTAATDGYTIGKLVLNGGTVGSNDTWASSTAIETSSSPWKITVTLGASGSTHKVTLTSPTTWTFTAGTSLLTAAVTDQAPACTSISSPTCTATTSGGGF